MLGKSSECLKSDSDFSERVSCYLLPSKDLGLLSNQYQGGTHNNLNYDNSYQNEPQSLCNDYPLLSERSFEIEKHKRLSSKLSISSELDVLSRRNEDEDPNSDSNFLQMSNNISDQKETHEKHEVLGSYRSFKNEEMNDTRIIEYEKAHIKSERKEREYLFKGYELVKKPIYQPIDYIYKYVEIPVKRIIETRVPKTEIKELVTYIDKPIIQKVQKIVEVPEIYYKDSIVEVPKKVFLSKPVLKDEIQTRITYVPKIEVKECTKYVEVHNSENVKDTKSSNKLCDSIHPCKSDFECKLLQFKKLDKLPMKKKEVFRIVSKSKKAPLKIGENSFKLNVSFPLSEKRSNENILFSEIKAK